MNFNVIVAELVPDAPGVVALKGGLAAFAHVLVDTSQSPPVATVRPNAAGIQEARILDALSAAVADAVAASGGGSGTKLDHGALVRRLNGITIDFEVPPCAEPQGMRARANLDAVPDTTPDRGPAIAPDVTGDVQLKVEPEAAASSPAAETPAELAPQVTMADVGPEVRAQTQPADSVGTEQSRKTPDAVTVEALPGAKADAPVNSKATPAAAGAQ